ncbi:MAG: CDP-glucose 4,6-dehydratase, partial [Pseudomonadota bacterium]
ARGCPTLRTAVIITTDKVYANPETGRPFVENDPLGGADPYSSSKACTEILCAAYRQSYFAARDLRLATARAGNVFGGGDWAAQRLIPDLLAAFAAGQIAELRRPEAVRPWQHVLAPLHGYLLLTEKLWQSQDFARGWNFGPEAEDCQPVAAVATQLAALWGDDARWQALPSDFPHEAGQLRLDASPARTRLAWQPRWSLAQGLAQTVRWQRAWLAGADLAAVCLRQIAEYCDD